MGEKSGQHVCTMLEELTVSGLWGTKRGGASVGCDGQGMTVGCVEHDSQECRDAMGRTCGHDGRGMMVECVQV